MSERERECGYCYYTGDMHSTTCPNRTSDERSRVDAAFALAQYFKQSGDYHAADIARQFEFVLKHGIFRHELKCDDCKTGDHYHCAHRNPSYPRCCCPERMGLNV